jgi:exonuclease III
VETLSPIANALKSSENVSTELDLIDAWRVLKPDSHLYTWRQKKPEIFCRLDFFLISQRLMCSVTSANISVGYKTDHSLIEIRIALHFNPKGPGFWKLNTSFLNETA